jgi:CheY-like chemotaxis protein
MGKLLELAYKKGAGVELNIAHVQSSQSSLHGCAKVARVLIADDDALMRRLLTHVVERTQLCCNVAIAENGNQAWQLYQRDGADLIITDNNMPVMDGIALTKAIRQEQPELPIIMVSASADLQQARAAGASIFLQKPFQIQCLLQNIVRCLSTHAIA